MKEIFLKSGELYCSKNPTVIRTVLGSCVSVCLYSPMMKFGGMNHFALPSGEESLRYGDVSIRFLIKHMREKNAVDLVAKIFGGSELIDSPYLIGKENIQQAEEILSLYQIPIISKYVGGNRSLRVEFFSHTGKVNIKNSTLEF